MTDLALLALVLALLAPFRQRMRSLPITPPIVLVAVGLLLGPEVLGVINIKFDDEAIVLLAELTLAMVLFADASRVVVRANRRTIEIPGRLLAFSLPLTIGLGTLLLRALLSDLSWAQAALVATVLAPTDAALGEAVVSNKIVPARIRQALNIESGINDGMVVPVFTVLLALVAGTELESVGSKVGEALLEILISLVIATIGALSIAKVLPFVLARDWIDHVGVRFLALGVALSAFAGTESLGGNGFVGVFVAGLIARKVIGPDVTDHSELIEELGQLGAWASFFLFGALLVVPAFMVVTPLVIVSALLILSVGRMIPVAISLIGVKLQPLTVGFLGWFGPRGLASLLFGLLLVTNENLTMTDDLFAVIVVTILGSVLLHGISAAPLSAAYGRWVEREREMMAESPEVEKVETEVRLRHHRRPR